MRDTGFCKHYRAMSGHQTCKAGINYEVFKGLSCDERPCFYQRKALEAARQKNEAPLNAHRCTMVEYASAEEIASEDAEIEARIARLGAVRKAIVASLGGPWRRGMHGESGTIDCPCCNGGKVRFTRAGSNGHIHAACSTPGCASWIE